jgi:hypothetical protein
MPVRLSGGRPKRPAHRYGPATLCQIRWQGAGERPSRATAKGSSFSTLESGLRERRPTEQSEAAPDLEPRSTSAR